MKSNAGARRGPRRPYRETGILALDLVNTWDAYLVDPERIPHLPDLRAFLEAHGVAEDPREEDLEAVRSLRTEIRRIVAAGTPAELIEGLAALAARLPVAAEVRERVPGRWMVTVAPVAGARLADRLAVMGVRGLGEILAHHGPERVGECRAAPCRDAFVDTSRSGGRRYCSKRCANRRNAAAFRRRRSRYRAGPD